MTYREQDYVDRCYCDAPAIVHCTMCNRPRCATHVEKDGHCHRCDEAIGYEMEPRSALPWWIGGGAGVALALGSMIAHVVAGVPIAIGIAIATGFGSRRVMRRRIERRLAPRLAASTGEVRPDGDYTPAPGHDFVRRRGF